MICSGSLGVSFCLVFCSEIELGVISVAGLSITSGSRDSSSSSFTPGEVSGLKSYCLYCVVLVPTLESDNILVSNSILHSFSDSASNGILNCLAIFSITF